MTLVILPPAMQKIFTLDVTILYGKDDAINEEKLHTLT